MDNILTCTSVGSHVVANKSFQNNFLNCVLKLLFRDTVVTHHLGFLKNTEQQLIRVRGDRGKQKANTVLRSIETIRKKLSTSKGGLSLLTAQVIGCGTLWAQWITLSITDAALCLSRTALLICLPVLVTDTGAARAGARDYNHQARPSHDQMEQKSMPFIPADLFPFHNPCKKPVWMIHSWD